MKDKFKIFSNILFISIIIILIIVVYKFYEKYYFNDYVKAQVNSNGTSFYRDTEIKYSKNRSYCIENKEFNDAVFYKKIDIEPNTPYRVTCMVKTENVENENADELAGACISLVGEAQQSKIVNGTTDWQEISLLFNSKSNEEIDIGFRLGGMNGNCKGKAWFSDIKVEKGELDRDNEWNVVCFMIDNIDVTLDGKRYTTSLTREDKALIEENLERFKSTCREFSNGEMTVKTNLIDIDDTIRSLSYDEANAFFISAKDVREIITPYLEQEEYDHIFIAVRMGDSNSGVEIPVNEWIGLRRNGL